MVNIFDLTIELTQFQSILKEYPTVPPTFLFLLLGIVAKHSYSLSRFLFFPSLYSQNRNSILPYPHSNKGLFIVPFSLYHRDRKSCYTALDARENNILLMIFVGLVILFQ